MPRSHLDVLELLTAERVEDEQQRQQKERHDTRVKFRTFEVGDMVFIKNFGSGQKWLPGTTTRSGSVLFQVTLQDGRICCHLDQIRVRCVTVEAETDSGSSEMLTDDLVDVSPTESVGTEQRDVTPTYSLSELVDSTGRTETSDHPETVAVRREYPQRQRKPREWFEPGKYIEMSCNTVNVKLSFLYHNLPCKHSLRGEECGIVVPVILTFHL